MGNKQHKDNETGGSETESKKTRTESHHAGRSKGDIQKKIKEMVPEKKQKEYLEKLDESQKEKEQYKKLSVADFTCLKTIGKGAFGEVRLAKLTSTGQLFALKRMIKKDMLKKQQVDHIRAERDVLALADNPWIVKLYYSFQDNESLYLAMEFLQGGDLMTILIAKDILTHEQTAFYMAELCLAVQSVHELNYIHRDLKPDNILMDSKGHLKLSDFGLCKSFADDQIESLGAESDEKDEITKDSRDHATKGKAWKEDRRKLAKSMVGTPDYMAPEIFTNKGYGEEVDWWSIGVIMYECLVGYAPFYGERPIDTARKILKFEDHFIFPPESQVSVPAADLMHKLVCRPEKRRKFLSRFDSIKKHPFFSAIKWDKIREMPAAIIPELKDPTDCSCFPDDYTSIDPNLSTAVSDQGQGKFVGYTYKIDSKDRGIKNDTFIAPPDKISEEDEGDEENDM